MEYHVLSSLEDYIDGDTKGTSILYQSWRRNITTIAVTVNRHKQAKHSDIDFRICFRLGYPITTPSLVSIFVPPPLLPLPCSYKESRSYDNSMTQLGNKIKSFIRKKVMTVMSMVGTFNDVNVHLG